MTGVVLITCSDGVLRQLPRSDLFNSWLLIEYADAVERAVSSVREHDTRDKLRVLATQLHALRRALEEINA